MTLRPVLFLIFITFSPSFAQNTPKTVEERKEWANSVYKKAILKNDSMLLAEAYYLYGKIEMIIPNNYVKAKLWFLKSLDILEKRGPGFDLARLYLKLSHNELFLKNFREAFLYTQKAVQTAEAAQNEDMLAETCWALALFYSGGSYSGSLLDETLALGPYTNKDSTLYYTQKAEKAARPDGRSSFVLSAIKLHNERTNTAGLEKLVKEISPGVAKSTFKAIVLLKLAETYIEEGNLNKAYTRLKDAQEVYRHISYFPYLERNISLIHIKYYEASGNFQKAYSLLKEVREKDHALLVQERNGEISDLESGFDATQKKLAAELIEMELNLQREKGRLQDRILLFVTLFIMFLVATVALLYLLNRKNRQISRQNALLVQEQNHRFNNNLQTVSDLLSLKSEELDAREAKMVFGESKLLLQAISTLQKKLYSGDKLVSVDAHLMIPEVVSNVLDAFNLTHIKMHYDLPPAEIHAEDALLLNLILTELTTNACKYAFKNANEPALNIAMNLSGDRADLTFRDNGTTPAETSGQSFGLYLVDLLVKQMQGTYRFSYDHGVVFEMKCKIRILHENTDR